MRPYRAILIGDKDFVYGWYVEIDNISFIEYQAEKSNNRCTVEVIPETVGQFTGLKDKNSKEGYAGDLIDVRDGDYEARGVVEWANKSGLWGWRATDTHNSLTIATNQVRPLWVILSKQHRYQGVIIGNIHQNPKLLEQEDEHN